MKITTGHCVACGACVSICPKGSVTLKKDAHGFYMPAVEAATCIDCKRCQQVCPVNHPPKGENWKNGSFFAVWDNDSQKRKAGSSGGAFGLLAEHILAQGGVVFGAAYAIDCKSVYQSNTDIVTLESLKKSKYVESYTGNIFCDVKTALDNGRSVLYCGTACQIQGLKNFLKHDYPNLLTCDFLCHGVPSAGIFEKYICDLEKKYGRVTHVDFRSKAFGWRAYCSKVTFESGKKYLKTRFQDPYLRIFFENNALRESCYSCQRLLNSCADITLGDFWGVTSTKDIPDTNDGISLLGAHTEAGKKALSLLNGQCYCQPLNQEHYAYAYRPRPPMPPKRDEALKTLLAQQSLMTLPRSPKTILKGCIYHCKALLQKRR